MHTDFRTSWSVDGPLHTQQLYERIADRIATEIRVGQLKPGDRLPSERELARRLEVGRSSVREAIAALQVKGVVETRPGSGSFVAHDAPDRVQDLALSLGGETVAVADASPTALLEARATFEPRIARLAAQRGQRDPYAEELLSVMEAATDRDNPRARADWHDADRMFHRQIAVMTGNPVLVAVAGYIAELMDQPLWQRLRDEAVAVRDRMQVHLAEHRMIYDGIAAGDPEVTEFYASQHIQRVRRYMTLD
jgi:DNA-binding FadR family transcriptional regulator